MTPEDLQRVAGQLVIREVREYLRDIGLDELIENNESWLADQALNYGKEAFSESDLDDIADLADVANVFIEIRFGDDLIEEDV